MYEPHWRRYRDEFGKTIAGFFSDEPQFPDRDCPPHFGAEGHDPQFEGFTALMRYANKAAHLLSGGHHVARAAILYHAEGEWMNGIDGIMPMSTPARILSDAHIPYEIVPRDALLEAAVADGGVMVDHLHIVRDGSDVFMFFNEEPSRRAAVEVRLPADGKCVCLKLLEDRVWREDAADGRLRLDLEPGESQIVVFGEESDAVADGLPRLAEPRPVTPVFEVSVADERDGRGFRPLCETGELFNIYDRLPDFAGRIRYRFAIDGAEAGFGVDGGRGVIDLGVVGEVAKLKVNGREAGIRIARPYRFEVELTAGRNEIEVEVATSLGMRMKDELSRYLAIPAAGLQGPVTLRRATASG